jgi:hypothetical protein
MPFLTTLTHGSILAHHDDSRRVDAGEIGSARCDDCVEVAIGSLHDRRVALPGLLGAERIPLDDDDLPAGELERPGVDPREAELQDAAGPTPQKLENLRRGGGGEGGRKPTHGYVRYTTTYRTGKFLANLAEVARSLGLRR